MVEPVKHRERDYSPLPLCTFLRGLPCRNLLSYPLMWLGSVEELHVFLDHPIQLTLSQDEDVIQTFPPYAPNKSLTDGIRPRRPVRNLHYIDPRSLRHPVQERSILAIVVPNQILRSFTIRRCFTQLLANPVLAKNFIRLQFDGGRTPTTIPSP